MDRYHICLFSHGVDEVGCHVHCGDISPDGLDTLVNDLLPSDAEYSSYNEWRTDDPTDTYPVHQWTWPTGRVLFSRP